jgi:hypothetical protein
MGSWVRCKCEELVHTNMFCGTGISLIVEEGYLDEERPNKSAEDFISELVVTRSRLLECGNCKRIIVLDERNNEIKYYKLEDNA